MSLSERIEQAFDRYSMMRVVRRELAVDLKWVIAAIQDYPISDDEIKRVTTELRELCE